MRSLSYPVVVFVKDPLDIECIDRFMKDILHPDLIAAPDAFIIDEGSHSHYRQVILVSGEPALESQVCVVFLPLII